MTQKELNNEGLTKEWLSQFSSKKLGNPVQLLPNDEPVFLLKCSTGFWVSVNKELVKDSKNNYLVVSDKEAIIGRARYVLNFSSEIDAENNKIKKEEIELAIKEEVSNIQLITKEQVKNWLNKIKTILQFAGELPADSSFTFTKMISNEEGDLEKHIEFAKEMFAQEGFKDLYEKVYLNFANENWDWLYGFFFQNGNFEIANFKEKDLNVMIKFIHREKLDETISEIISKSHIENVARFNVEKRFNLSNPFLLK